MTARRIAGVVVVAAALVVASTGTAHARGLTYVVGHTKTLTSGTVGTVRATCPDRPSVHVWGGGQYVNSDPFDSTVTASSPFDGGDRAQAPDDGWPSTVRNVGVPVDAAAVAICASGPTQYVTRDISVGPRRRTDTGRVRCEPGTKVVGGGVDVDAAYGDFGWIESSAPYDGRDAGKRRDDGWKVTAGVQKRKRTMTITAVCADAEVRYVLKRRSAARNTDSDLLVHCPRATHVVGGGETASSAGRIAAITSIPFDDPDRRAEPDDGWYAEFDAYGREEGRITTYAICLV